MNSSELIPHINIEALPRPKVLGVSASPRNRGNSDVLLRHILKGAGSRGVTSCDVRLADINFDPCIGCEQCRKNNICTGKTDAMTLLYPKIIESKGLVLVSPTHNYNITAWMKAFIDRLYCFYEFDNNRPRGWSSRLGGQNRKAVIAAVCEQTDKDDMGLTLDAMRKPIEALGYDMVGELPVFSVFDKAGVKKFDNILKMAESLGSRLAESITDD